ncbi:MAG: DUF554 domain-containing protein [Lachnospiraceae bacterium]|nr:DUF554 domain-containing protein [Lachnospiraceae bacterium]
MPVGIIINVLAVAIGGLLGSRMGHKLPERMKELLTMTFGVCAIVMGIVSVILIRNLPAVILSVIAGTVIGSALRLSERIRRGTENLAAKLFREDPAAPAGAGAPADKSLLVTAIVLFCASGSGIYGSLVSGMDSDHSVLLAKSVLDFFTAIIFACRLKKITALIAVSQLIIMLLLFFSARLIFPLTTEVMIADFKACGGILLLATGFTIMKVKVFPMADLLPAMVLVMPVSWLWTQFIAPLL